MGLSLSSRRMLYLDQSHIADRWRDDAPLYKLLIIGTHNSCASTCKSALYKWVNCQTLSIPDQLKFGVRFLDVRGYLCPETNVLKCHHGPFSLLKTVEDVVLDCAKFLALYPREFIILKLQNENCLGGKAYAACVSKLITKFTGLFWRREQPGCPTVGQVRGKIVLFDRFDGNALIPCLDYNTVNIRRSRKWPSLDPWEFPSLASLEVLDIPLNIYGIKVDIYERICLSRMFRNQWFQIDLSGSVVKTFLKIPLFPSTVAGHENGAFCEMLTTAQSCRDSLTQGIVVMDFPSPEILLLLANRQISN
ncbi:MAG: hypothetical protein SGCHY_003295 [Lobulomycetales sp.]